MRRGQGGGVNHMENCRRACWHPYSQCYLFATNPPPKKSTTFSTIRPAIPKSIYSPGFLSITDDGLGDSLGINNNQSNFFLKGNQKIVGKHQPRVTQWCPNVALIQWPQAFPSKSNMVGWQKHRLRSQRPGSRMSSTIVFPSLLLCWLRHYISTATVNSIPKTYLLRVESLW